ncbi:MAG: hypothetical protein V4608_16810 [Bacteroidota bacterium]
MKKPYIHILENNAIAGLDIKNQLEKSGFIVKHDPFTLELNSDAEFPDMIISTTGIQNQEGFQELKGLFIKTQLPIICVGSKLDDVTLEECKGVNIIGKFVKPYDSEDIINLIVDYFNKENVILQREFVND